MYLLEITAAVDASGNTQTFYVSDDNFVTTPTDTPANTAFDPILLSQGSIGRYVYSDGRTGGNTKLDIGEVILTNIDGQIDTWIDYSFDGRQIKIYKGDGGAYPADFTQIFTGTMDGIELTFDKAILRIRDKSYLFDVPVSSNSYLGNNSLPSGLEGVAEDIKGQKKPICYGVVYNVTPILVNTSRLIYQVNDGAISTVDAVYDRRSPLTKGSDYTSQSDMETTAPSAGYYRVWPAGGYFRIGSNPSGQITADVTQGASASNRTVAQVLKLLAEKAGLTSGEINSSDITTLDTANNSVIGIYLQDETILESMDEIASSINAWYGFDESGVYRVGQLTTPASSVMDIYDYDLLEGIDRRIQKDIAIPTWKVNVSHSKNYTVQDSDIAGSVTQASRAWAAEEYRTEYSSNINQLKWKLSQEYAVQSLLTSAANAATEATRLLSLYGTRRDIFEISLDIDTYAGVNLMDTVTVYLNRFAMDSGRLFRVIGIYLQLENNKATLTLWG